METVPNQATGNRSLKQSTARQATSYKQSKAGNHVVRVAQSISSSSIPEPRATPQSPNTTVWLVSYLVVRPVPYTH